jgi:GntR family transcriptional regulator, arabinose operon transcriptional repressor
MVSRRSVLGFILDRLHDDINSGLYKPGTFLPTERSLAEELGVSKGTVHNALGMLQKEGAITLVSGKGALVAAQDDGGKKMQRIFFRPSNSGFYGGRRSVDRIIGGICHGAELNNAEVVMSFSDDKSLTGRILERYAAGEIQGVVYLQCRHYDILAKPLEKAGIPFISAQHESGLNIVSVSVDFRETARRAVRHLVELGHRKIGILHGEDNFFYREFITGFRGALAEENLEFNPEWQIKCCKSIDGFFGPSELGDALNATDRPSAFFTVRDYRAEYLFEHCSRLGLKIPDDMSVISFDNRTWLESAKYGLTSFQEPVFEMGKKAVMMLKDWIETGVRPISYQFNCELSIRNSTAVLKKR